MVRLMLSGLAAPCGACILVVVWSCLSVWSVWCVWSVWSVWSIWSDWSVCLVRHLTSSLDVRLSDYDMWLQGEYLLLSLSSTMPSTMGSVGISPQRGGGKATSVRYDSTLRNSRHLPLFMSQIRCI